MDNIQRVVRKLVSTIGESVWDIAISIDASAQSVYKWLNGTSMPDGEHMLKLIKLASEKQSIEQIMKDL